MRVGVELANGCGKGGGESEECVYYHHVLWCDRGEVGVLMGDG
jgi:hypothetical protein